MKAVNTPETTTTLTLTGDKTGERDLPAARIMAYDSDLGETPNDARPAFETTWEFEHLERLRVMKGARLRLRVHGTGHPPVSLEVDEMPDEAPQLFVEWGHIVRALGCLYADVAAFEGEPIEAPVFLDMFEEALRRTAQPPGEDGPPAVEITYVCHLLGGGRLDGQSIDVATAEGVPAELDEDGRLIHEPGQMGEDEPRYVLADQAPDGEATYQWAPHGHEPPEDAPRDEDGEA